MERPKRQDFMSGHPQIDHSTDLAKYYVELEKYVDFIESSQTQLPSSEKQEILKQIELIEAMEIDTRAQCVLQLVEVRKLKLLLRAEVSNSKCGCKDRPGETKLWCCNLCGKRTENF